MIRLSAVEKKARSLGIKDTWKYSRRDLIRTIQKTEGNMVCFATGVSACDQLACCWRMDCIK